MPTRAGLLADLEQHMIDQAGYQVATLNLDHIVKLKTNGDFRAAYGAHSHVTADGNPIVWLSKLAKTPVELIPGSELVEPLAELAGKHRVPVGLFGASDASLAEAANALEERFPGLKVVATIAPPMGFDPHGEDAARFIDELAAADVRLCYLALGAPKQELFAMRASQKMPNCGFLSIGAGLDFISGAQVRAPLWVRKLAMEWLWRLLQSPGRLWRRYWGCLVVLPGLALRARKAGQQTGSGA